MSSFKATSQIRERDIEQYLVSSIAKLGGKAYKFSSPGNRAVPDRICVLPEGIVVFVECKAPNKNLSPLQENIMRFLGGLKLNVCMVDSKNGVNHLCALIKQELEQRRKP